MSNDAHEKLIVKLDTLTKLVAGILLKNAKSQTEKIELLSNLGISNKVVAELIGCSEDTVGVVKNRLKKERTSKGGKQSAED